MNEEFEIILNSSDEQKKNFSYIKYANRNLLIILLIFFSGSIITGIIVLTINNKLSPYVAGAIELLFMLIPTLLLSKSSPLKFKTLFRLETMPQAKQIVIAIIGLIAFIVFEGAYLVVQEALIPSSLIGFYKNLEKTIEDTYLQILGGSGWLQAMRALLIGALIPALSEESLFRGFYQRSLEEEMKPLKAIFITGIIFAIIHTNPIGIVPLIVIGLYLGIIAYSTQSLLLPILIHFLLNAFSVFVIFIPSLSGIDEKSFRMNLGTSIIICILSFSIIFFVSVMMFRSVKKE
jgi:membrane protease YdiL (CAAX protease family)